MLIIDRFENNTAICEADDGTFIRIPCEHLPSEAKEGSVLVKVGEDYCIDIEETRRRMRKSQKKLANLFKTLDFLHRDSSLNMK